MKNTEKKLPSKITMNLMMREKSTYTPMRTLVGLIAVVILSLVVGKFAVADRIWDLVERQNALNAVTEENARIAEEAADYEMVYEEYSKFSSGWMTEEEQALYGRMDILDKVQSQFMAAGHVSQFSIAGNVLSVDFVNTPLSAASDLMSRLKEFPEVVGVDLYTANNQTTGNGGISLSMTVTFQIPGTTAEGGAKS
ncbi:MAG: hypothetical protein RRY64_07180 [Oscillospiraceae bacterium]